MNLRNQQFGQILLYALPVVYLLLYFTFYPQRLLNADEISYFNRALSIANLAGIADTDLNNYPLGTSVYYATFIKVFGIQSVFFASALQWVGVYSLMLYLLRKQGIPLAFVLLFAVNIPCLFSATMVMSDLISALLVLLGVHTALTKTFKRRTFFTALLFSTGIWFRETNVVCLLPLLVYITREDKKYAAVFVGGLLGLLPRLLTSFFTYGDLFYYRSPGYGFSLSNIIENLPLFCINLLFLTPLVFILFWRKATAKQYVALQIGCLLHLLLYLLYGYHGGDDFKSAIYLYGRFFIPLSPLVIVLVGDRLRGYQISTKITGLSMGVVLGVFMLLFSAREYLELKFEEAQKAVNATVKQSVVIPPRSEYLKYFNQIVYSGQHIEVSKHPVVKNNVIYPVTDLSSSREQDYRAYLVNAGLESVVFGEGKSQKRVYFFSKID